MSGQSAAPSGDRPTEGARPDARGRRGPGRPRSARAHKAILDATLDLLAAEGFQALTIEAVAAGAGVSKMTIYRWWPSKVELVREALWRLAEPTPVPDTGSAREDVVAHLRRIVEQARDLRIARISADGLAEALRNKELDAARGELVAARRAPLRQALERGVARGELPQGIDFELTMDLLTAPIVLRGLITRDSLDPTLAERIVERVLGGLTAPS